MPDDPDLLDERDAAAILATLADPIAWELQPQRGNQCWRGRYLGFTYDIAPPVAEDDPDTVEFMQQWRIVQKPGSFRSNAPTLAAAKALCTRHALSGDISEMDRVHDQWAADAEWYLDTEQATLALLEKIYCDGHDIPLLPIDPLPAEEPKPMTFTLTGKRGAYAVHWDPVRRWVVTFTPAESEDDKRTLTRCFLTRQIVHRSCSVHAHEGRWVATLTEVPPSKRAERSRRRRA